MYGCWRCAKWKLKCLEERQAVSSSLTGKTSPTLLDWITKRMSEILSQLGDLLLRAIPTAVLFATVWFAYRTILERKLTDVLSDRRKRTEGAMEKARADISAAEGRSAEYERRIREAKAAMYAAQEVRRRKDLEAKVTAITEARKAALTRTQGACEEINGELTRAKSQLQANVDSFVDQIVARILKRAPVTEPIESTTTLGRR